MKPEHLLGSPTPATAPPAPIEAVRLTVVEVERNHTPQF